MDLVLAFVVFAGSMSYILSHGWLMVWGMLIGFAAFMATALHRGFAFRALADMAFRGAVKTLLVVRVLLIIGVLTGIWRASGTFAVLVVWGLKLVTPSLFVLEAFLLACVVSYAIGTSFGVAGTVGVTLMTLARSCGADEIITAGAVMSGIYFGDRGSPASSCALLVASVTETELYDNLARMLKTAIFPILGCVVFYTFLSFRHPIVLPAEGAMSDLGGGFTLVPWVVLPAVIMLVLPLFKVKPICAFLTSIACAFVCAVVFQGLSPVEAVSVGVLGLHAEAGSPRALFNGGGLVSMINMCAVVFISGTYSGIFDGTGMLADVQSWLSRMVDRLGAFPVMACTGAVMDGVFCNQTIGVMMSAELLERPYLSGGRSRPEFAQDIACSTVVLAGIIPTCIGCTVPYTMMGASLRAIPYAAYLYLVPICYLFTKKLLFKRL